MWGGEGGGSVVLDRFYKNSTLCRTTPFILGLSFAQELNNYM